MTPPLELEIIPVVSHLFDENAYIVRRVGDPRAVVVDPGADADTIERTLQDNKLHLQAILNTHGHADHIAGNEFLKRCWPEAPIVVGQGDAAKLRDPHANLSAPFGVPIVSPAPDDLVQEGDSIEWAGLPMVVRATPGHSAGHVVFVVTGAAPWRVFGGDVLFAGGIGRSDFPDSDPAALVESIRSVLYSMPDDTIVYPGHGPPTTIGRERMTNPFVRG